MEGNKKKKKKKKKNVLYFWMHLTRIQKQNDMLLQELLLILLETKDISNPICN